MQNFFSNQLAKDPEWLPLEVATYLSFQFPLGNIPLHLKEVFECIGLEQDNTDVKMKPIISNRKIFGVVHRISIQKDVRYTKESHPNIEWKRVEQHYILIAQNALNNLKKKEKRTPEKKKNQQKYRQISDSISKAPSNTIVSVPNQLVKHSNLNIDEIYKEALQSELLKKFRDPKQQVLPDAPTHFEFDGDALTWDQMKATCLRLIEADSHVKGFTVWFCGDLFFISRFNNRWLVIQKDKERWFAPKYEFVEDPRLPRPSTFYSINPDNPYSKCLFALFVIVEQLRDGGATFGEDHANIKLLVTPESTWKEVFDMHPMSFEGALDFFDTTEKDQRRKKLKERVANLNISTTYNITATTTTTAAGTTDRVPNKKRSVDNTQEKSHTKKKM